MGRHSKEEQQPQTVEALEAILVEQKKARGGITGEIEKTKLALEAAKRAEFQELERQQNLWKLFVPTLHDKEALNNRKIEIIYTNTHSGEKRRGVKAITAPGLDLAQQLDAVFKDIGATADVTARTWSTSLPGVQSVALDAENAFKKAPPCLSLDAPAEYIMKRSESAKDKGKNYIVVTNGRVYGGDIKVLALKLAFLELDPKATLDFVVYGAADKTPIDRLVRELQGKSAGKQVGLVKVASKSEVFDAVAGVIKGHVIAAIPPKEEVVVKKAPSMTRRVAHWVVHGQKPMA